MERNFSWRNDFKELGRRVSENRVDIPQIDVFLYHEPGQPNRNDIVRGVNSGVISDMAWNIGGVDGKTKQEDLEWNIFQPRLGIEIKDEVMGDSQPINRDGDHTFAFSVPNAGYSFLRPFPLIRLKVSNVERMLRGEDEDLLIHEMLHYCRGRSRDGASLIPVSNFFYHHPVSTGLTASGALGGLAALFGVVRRDRRWFLGSLVTTVGVGVGLLETHQEIKERHRFVVESGYNLKHSDEFYDNLDRIKEKGIGRLSQKAFVPV